MNLNIETYRKLALEADKDALKKNNEKLVLVTGANGFLSSHIIQQLLSLNYRVRGTVRNADDKTKTAHFNDVVPKEFFHNLSFVSADLTQEKGWDEAVSGSDYVIHVASPFTYSAQTEEELVRPAVLGTQLVLNACVKHHQTVKKVVLTSSGKAIFEGNYGQFHFDESHWQNVDNAGFYGRSKYFAEKEAWKIYAENPNKLNLTVINPTLILGPSLSDKLSSSQTIVTNLLSGKLVPSPVCLGIVDVRDVAAAHIGCIQSHLIDSTKGKRYIICTQSMWLKDIAAVYSEYYRTSRTDLTIHTRELTHEEFAEKAKVVPIFREQLRQSGQYLIMDNGRSLRELGMQYIPIYTTLINTSDEILKNGL